MAAGRGEDIRTPSQTVPCLFLPQFPHLEKAQWPSPLQASERVKNCREVGGYLNWG